MEMWMFATVAMDGAALSRACHAVRISLIAARPGEKSNCMDQPDGGAAAEGAA